jgi:acetyl esterase/lipase
MGMRCWLFSIMAVFNTIMVHAQQELPLYGSQPIPNSRPGVDREKVDTEQSSTSVQPVRYSFSQVSRPTLTVFLPAAGKGNGTAVVVCPGGGYTHLAMTHEGTDVARWLNSLGITAFVLKYRLPSDETMVDKTIGPLQDAQRAIQLVRQRAGEWGVDAGKVGILGFSAGGHLASTAGTHFLQTTIANSAQVSLRPDFMILLYPVISFSDSIGHMGSRESLIGKHPDSALVLAYSNERQVTPRTPPTFIVHAEDDKTVPVMNSLNFYEALVRHGVPAELHVYPRGGHGWGLWNSLSKEQWPDECQRWMEVNGWIKN